MINHPLPSSNACLEEILYFVDRTNPSKLFMERWEEEYTENARRVWSECLEIFKQDRPLLRDNDEILLCLQYHCSVAPILGLDENSILPFLHWLIGNIKTE